MPSEALKSTSITNLDSTPVTVPTTGEGSAGFLRNVSDSLTITTGKTSGSTYKLVRFPSNAKVKHLRIWLDGAITTLDADIDVAYSDSTVDGTSSSNQGTIIQVSSADNKIFGTAVDLHAVITPVDYVINLTAANQNKAMWSVLGLTVDPGCMFDIVLKTTSTNSGAGIINCMLEYVI